MVEWWVVFRLFRTGLVNYNGYWVKDVEALLRVFNGLRGRGETFRCLKKAWLNNNMYICIINGQLSVDRKMKNYGINF